MNTRVTVASLVAFLLLATAFCSAQATPGTCSGGASLSGWYGMLVSGGENTYPAPSTLTATAMCRGTMLQAAAADNTALRVFRVRTFRIRTVLSRLR